MNTLPDTPSYITDIPGVIAWLNGQTLGGSLTITPLLFDDGTQSTPIDNLFAILLGDPPADDSGITMTITTIDTTTTPDAPSVTGTMTLFDVDSTTVTCSFTEQADPDNPDQNLLVMQLDYTFPLGTTWALIPDFAEFTNISGTMWVEVEINNFVFMNFTAQIVLGSEANPVTLDVLLSVPSYQGNWQLFIKSPPTVSGDGIGALLQAMAAGIDVSDILPPDILSGMNHFLFKDFQIVFQPNDDSGNGGSWSYIQIDIDYAANWQIFDWLILQDIDMKFSLTKYPDKTIKQVDFIGNLIIDPTGANIPVRIEGLFPDMVFSLAYQPLDTIPENNALLSTFKIPALPSGFTTALTPPSGNINISFLSFVLALGNGVVPASGSLTVAITDRITLIPDKLSLDNFYLYLSATYSSSIVVSGTLSAGITIFGVPVVLSGTYQSDGEFSLSCDIYNLDIGTMIGDLGNLFGINPQIPTGTTLTKTTITYSTNGNFSFDSTATIPLSEHYSAEAEINIDVTKNSGDDKGYSVEAGGKLTIENNTFEVTFSTDSKQKILSARWLEDGSLSLADIASVLGDTDITNLLSDIPPNMDLALQSASLSYDFGNSLLIFTASSKNYGNAVFVAEKIDTTWVFVMMLGIQTIDLTKLPLIGTTIGALGQFEINNLQLFLCSGALTSDQVQTINQEIAKAAASMPQIPVSGSDGVVKCVGLSMTFVAPNGYNVPVQINTSSSTNNHANHAVVSQSLIRYVSEGNGRVGSVSGLPSPSGNAYWIVIQKGIGPVYVDKIGITYKNGALECLFNISLKMGALTLGLDGLTIGSPFSKFQPEFNLQGVSITFNSSAAEISGGFIKQVTKEGITEYNGEALIKVGTFLLSAMGSYADIGGTPSLFIFALMTDPPLGGPPYLFITGVAAGFGYNRSLQIPDIDGVSSFPLVQGFVPGKSSPFSSPDPGAALQVLVEKNVVPIQIGTNWFAAGIQFTSFEMLQSYALLIVEFGNTTEIGLLGMTTVTIPAKDPTNPILFAELALEAKILPESGLIAVNAKITPSSYIFDSACKLTGGFAFYTWYGNNPHAGDFVVTLGGYNPNFIIPSHYPQVPRLGFNWVVTSELTIKGGIYFALTPSCLMAGGRLEAVWQSGNLKAWFDVQADFLIAWKPYHYQADIYVNFGVSYTFNVDLLFTTITETISVSLGADLQIWGPSFSGNADIHLWIVSFSVSFGSASSQAPGPISWEEFGKSFLSQSSNIGDIVLQPSLPTPEEPIEDKYCSVQITNGLIKDISTQTNNDINWIVRPQGIVFRGTSLCPSKTYTLAIGSSTAQPFTNNVNFGIGPVNIAPIDFKPQLSITLQHEDGAAINESPQINAILQSIPKALWQQQSSGTASDSSQLIENVLIGFEIVFNETSGTTTAAIDITLLEVENTNFPSQLAWSAPNTIPNPVQPQDPYTELKNTMSAQDAPQSRRSNILNSLRANGFNTAAAVNDQHIINDASIYLLAPPIFT